MKRRVFLEIAGAALAAGPVFCQEAKKPKRPLPKSEYDYVDWSWEKWRRITGARRPNGRGRQTGKAELIDLALKEDGKTITTEEWKTRRIEVLNHLSAFLGPQPRSKPPLCVEILSEEKRGRHVLRKLRFQSEPGEYVPAYLLIPQDARGPTSAVICPHQTTQAGMREPAGLAGDRHLYTALSLAERGFVTFTYDALCFGERHDPASGHYGDAIPFYRRYPRRSLLGKMVWDFSRAVDYLETLDIVDRRKIASIGRSHGGYTTLFSMAFDERIAAGVSNCGFDTFRIDGNTFRWSKATALIPLLGFYASNPRLNMDFYRAVPDSSVVEVPFELHEMLALIAPRPLLLSASDEDFVFPNGGWSTRRAVAKLKPLYEILGKTESLETYYFAGGHSFPAEASANAYRWLERTLR